MNIKFILTIILTMIFQGIVYGAPEYEALKAKYLLNRNRDFDFSKVKKWEDLRGRYKKWIKKYKKSQDFELANFHLLQIECGLNGDSDCSDLFLNFVSKFKDSEFSDNVLVDLSEIKLNHDLEDEALKYLKKVVRDYPDGDMADFANIKIEQIKKGNYESQSDLADIEDKEGKFRIVLDPGHGGEDFGAIGKSGIYEKDVVLSISYELKNLIDKNSNYEIFLTRYKDEFVPLSKRTEFANSVEADLFLSLHVNASKKNTNSGLEIYYLDNSKGEAGKILAKRENESIKYEGVQEDVYSMLADLVQNVKQEESLELAEIMEKGILGEVNKKYQLRSLGIRKAPFYVLIGAHMPCILLEMFYVDHKLDGKLLSKKEFRKLIAKGIFNAINEYYKKREHK